MRKIVQDLCKFLNLQKGNRLVRTIFEKFKGDKRIPKSCPIEPGCYFANDIIFDGNSTLVQNVDELKTMTDYHFGTKTKGKMNYFFKLRVYVDFKDRLKWQKEQLINKTKTQKKKI
ncbi:CLUMA_CG001213, isoform A [Clunio marinus]|uniref:CLUMA_CG001213, isoform A n=1 Tax=Clunio marinus TaxID=568069 RepID=A0A1J1HHP6_9DIPT|nr:CLUMA_CG001213, isoform A [Clunio marinus]